MCTAIAEKNKVHEKRSNSKNLKVKILNTHSVIKLHQPKLTDVLDCVYQKNYFC